MRVEVQITPEKLTDAEVKKGVKCARLAICMRCKFEARGVGATDKKAGESAIEAIKDGCPKSDEWNKYERRKIPPGVLIEAQFTDQKWYRCQMDGWNIFCYGVISKSVPVRLVADVGCKPDKQMVDEFAQQLFRHGYRVTIATSEPIKPQKGAAVETEKKGQNSGERTSNSKTVPGTVQTKKV